jgi:diketogulonate reductase-like aldo/keto reductase
MSARVDSEKTVNAMHAKTLHKHCYYLHMRLRSIAGASAAATSQRYSPLPLHAAGQIELQSRVLTQGLSSTTAALALACSSAGIFLWERVVHPQYHPWVIYTLEKGPNDNRVLTKKHLQPALLIHIKRSWSCFQTRSHGAFRVTRAFLAPRFAKLKLSTHLVTQRLHVVTWPRCKAKRRRHSTPHCGKEDQAETEAQNGDHDTGSKLMSAITTHIVTKRLPSGAEIPTLGFGSYLADYADVLSALKLGYRHIDTAELYDNEEEVGRAVRDSGIPREQIFVTSKLFINNWGYNRAVSAIRASNARLGLGYIDLYLLHAPGRASTRAETWRALEDLQAEGVLRDIGVSNFSPGHYKRLAKTWRVKPAVNQVELHPWLTRTEVVQFFQAEGVYMEAYSPLAKAMRMRDPEVEKVAQEVNASVGQVLVAYSLAKDYISLPKSSSPARQRENLEAASIKLTKEQVDRLDALDEYFVTDWDPIRDELV